jgi:lipopolysaccharide/colanic/teichoic acid biosynthesis glycosyltransferase
MFLNSQLPIFLTSYLRNFVCSQLLNFGSFVYNPAVKRFLDIFLSLAAIAVFSPLMVLVSLLVHAVDKGPVFFYQERIGQGFRPFRLIKFRTMSVRKPTESGEFEAGNTRRVTRIGRLLRVAKIDELPELFNILKGEMAVVGPRPEVRPYVALYPEAFRAVLTVRPGLSDFASIKYRNEEALLAAQPDPEGYYQQVVLPDKLALARDYVQTVSFKNDLKIIASTIKSVSRAKTQRR